MLLLLLGGAAAVCVSPRLLALLLLEVDIIVDGRGLSEDVHFVHTARRGDISQGREEGK